MVPPDTPHTDHTLRGGGIVHTLVELPSFVDRDNIHTPLLDWGGTSQEAFVPFDSANRIVGVVGEESLAVPHTHQMLKMAFEDTAQPDTTHTDIPQLPEPPGRKRLDLHLVPLVIP